ncbi:DMT family transporter [Flavitalea sp.]|nr:EamA family transporter [Flavitalea sp.]
MNASQPGPVRIRAMAALAMVCFFWGTTWIASEEGVGHMPALQLAGIRQSFGGILYVIYFLAKGYRLPKGREWWPVFVLSLLNFVLTNGLTTLGLKYISPGLGAIISAIFPLWIVVIGLFRDSTLPPLKALTGLLLGFAGICIIFYDHLNDFLDADFRQGIILSIIASWTWAFGTLYTKSQATKFNPYFSVGLQMLISGIIMGGISVFSGSSIPLVDIPWQGWAAIAYLVVFGSVISFVAYLYALQHLPTEQASIYAYMNPVVAVLSGFLVYGDPLTIYLAVGGAVILYGVYLVNKVYRKV